MRTGWYGFPDVGDGIVKIGNHGPGYRMHPDEPIDVPEQHLGRTREFLRETFPDLLDAEVVKSRICLYCDAWDGAFYVDHDPDRPCLVVASGGSGHGFKFAPVLGDLIADVVEHRENRFAQRFRWRPRGEISGEAARAS
jgi:glycine/D-amino acid oxidase-like deaminating enzyme